MVRMVEVDIRDQTIVVTTDDTTRLKTDIAAYGVPARKTNTSVISPLTWPNLVRWSRLVDKDSWLPSALDEAEGICELANMLAELAAGPPLPNLVPPHGGKQLSPAQTAGAQWLASSKSAILADEMGSGKTVMTCAALRELRNRADIKRVLVVCPKPVIGVWVRHIAEMVPLVPVEQMTGSRHERIKTWRDYEAMGITMSVLVVPWSTLRLHTGLSFWPAANIDPDEQQPKELDQMRWDVVVFDEAHRAKNPAAKQTLAAWSIRADRIWSLTGTPVANEPTDFWAMLRLVDPKSWQSKWKFIDRYAEVSHTQWGLSVDGWRDDRLPELLSLAAPTFRRRSLDENTGRRTDRVAQRLEVELAPEQRKQYDQLMDEWRADTDGGEIWTPNAIARAVRLCQVAAACIDVDDTGAVQMRPPSAKLDALTDFLRDLSEQAVVFCQSAKFAELSEMSLRLAGVDAVCIIGDMDDDERNDRLARWRHGAQALCMTYGVGAEGLSLDEARTVVHTQATWSLVQRMQADDRVRRFTQQSATVRSVDIVALNTIDRAIMNAMFTKRDLLDAVTPRAFTA